MTFILGTNKSEKIYGTLSNDTIFAKNGDDLIGGGYGNDEIYGQGGNDKIYDTIGSNWISGGDGNDYIFCGAGDDKIYGNNGSDYLYGGAGKDSIFGGNDADVIRDVFGYNDISGGQGVDRIEFSGSSHRVYGGDYGVAGDKTKDIFVLASWHENVDLTITGQKGDVIGDFEVGIDTLNLAELGIQASSVTIGKYVNGYMVKIDDGIHKLDIGIRTGLTGLLTQSDILTA